MPRSLFIGCSHTMGYQGFETLLGGRIKDPPHVWGDNNYAEKYSKSQNKNVVIMASAGTGNPVFPRFLAYALKKYDDIDEVFIQSTYWGRFPVVINPDLDEKKIFPLDFFIKKEHCDSKIDRYSISLSVDGKYLEHYIKPEPQDYEIMPYIQETSPWKYEPDTRRSSHMYMQMWHHSNTHLVQEEYFRTIALCDMLCSYKNIPLYVWNINERCYIPHETKNYYIDLKSTKFATIDAVSFLKNKKINVDKIDGEHYSHTVHEAIAREYIPFLKSKNTGNKN
jgi:hypothetical protein